MAKKKKFYDVLSFYDAKYRCQLSPLPACFLKSERVAYVLSPGSTSSLVCLTGPE